MSRFINDDVTIKKELRKTTKISKEDFETKIMERAKKLWHEPPRNLEDAISTIMNQDDIVNNDMNYPPLNDFVV